MRGTPETKASWLTVVSQQSTSKLGFILCCITILHNVCSGIDGKHSYRQLKEVGEALATLPQFQQGINIFIYVFFINCLFIYYSFILF
jgi:hypothetical protein